MTNEEVRTIQETCAILRREGRPDTVREALLAEVDRLNKALAEAEARIERLIAQTGGGTAAARIAPGQFSRLRARFVIDAEELPF